MFFSSCNSPEKNTTEEEKYVEFYRVEEANVHLAGQCHPQFDHRKIKEAVRREKSRIMAVLAYYGIPFRYMADGRIMIPESQAEEEKHMFNLVSKANDTVWCRKHITGAIPN